MKKSDKKLIMFIGKTHSGKTTLAKELEKTKSNVINIEADPIALFLNKNFPKLNKGNKNYKIGKSQKISLKFKTFLLFVESAMALEENIILSNSNLYQSGRELIFSLCNKYNYKIICVYFNFPEDFLLQRIKKSKRTTKILRISKNFYDLIINQRTRIQPPNPKNFDDYFVIKSEKDLKGIKNKLIKILE
jgi:predicted kinase